MRIELRRIDESNREECLTLRVAPGQSAYIADNGRSLQTAAENPAVARPFAIYANGQMVGFAMFAFDGEIEAPRDRFWLWRFMIDASRQGRGYGRAALREVIRYFREQGACEITLSTKPDNVRALALYHGAGFRENGERNGEEIVLKLACDGENEVPKQTQGVEYRRLYADEICRELFTGFIRLQKVVNCRRREQNTWVIREDPFIDDWTEEDYRELVHQLRRTANAGGLVCAGFCGGMLKGFVSVEAELFGPEREYVDLAHIYVSEDMRRRGMGRALFCMAKSWARDQGARKLYISAQSAVESQAFYEAMGCVEARVYSKGHVEKEPYDCQMECGL